MTNLTLSTVLAAAALFVAAAGLVAAAPETDAMTVSINGLGGHELTPVTQSVVASASDRTF